MNVDDPKLTAYALGELSAGEKLQVEAAVAESPEAQRVVSETQELAKILSSEYESERKGEPVTPVKLIDIHDDPWFWSIARPLSIAAVIAVFALISAIAVSTYRRGGIASHTEEFASNDKDSVTFELPSGLAPSPVKPFADVEGEVGPPPAATPPAVAKAVTESNFPTGGEAAPNPIDTLQGKSAQLGVHPSAKTVGKQLAIATPRGALLAGTGDDKTNITVPSEYYNRGAIFSRDAQPAAKLTGSSAMAAQQAPAAPEFYEKQTVGGIRQQSGEFNTAAYDHILENPFLDAANNPLSTFSIDVDTASYSNIRRFINQGSLPPKDAVRLEEMINYFTYDYPQPTDDKPFSINVDVAGCPWETSHRLVRIGLKGREIAIDKRGASNLVFLLDVSGSMTPPERLPLVKQAMRLLVEKLTENDRVAIVVYAGASGLALPSTTGDHKEQILSAIENLQPGGSTNGAEGIELAYKIAADNFIKSGVNRVILATDGDFNVGVTNQGDLIRLIQEKAKTGVFLSVLGVGTDNLKDSTMQKLADKGNGNYAYLDSLDEARKVLVQQMNGTLVTIAKDVKIQVEFNPARVASYRLIGYEKRMLRKEDFNNDKIDAGEIGAGHTVTALYEVVPAGATANPAASVPPIDPLKYSASAKSTSEASASASGEMLTVKLRHKKPDGDKSELIEHTVVDSGAGFEKASADFKYAAAVAEFGMLLRDSEHKGTGTMGAVLEWAQEGKGNDANGYRAGFIELVRKAQTLRKG
jgi:Ca-activated chloride channel family protein